MSRKHECIAMLLAGGQGSRLGILTKNIAKPAVPYGGKYRIIDFPLSNCVNSGIYTVGVLTQYQPLELNDFSPPISRYRVPNGTRAQQMPFIRILTLLTDTTPNTFSFFRATISIKWTIPRCFLSTRRRMRTAQ